MQEILQKYTEIKERKERMWMDSEVHFRRAALKRDNSPSPERSQERAVQDSSLAPSAAHEELLNNFNRVVLKSNRDLLQ